MEFLELVVKFVVKYWAQISVLLLGIGFIIKVYSDWEIRKKDILFSKIYENKIKEVREFLEVYIELEDLLRQLPFIISQKNIDYSEISKKLSNLTLKFRFHIVYVRFFLKKNEIIALDELHEKITFIISTINELEVNMAFNHNDKELFKKLTTIRTTDFTETLPTLIKKIEENFKKDYKIT